MVVTAVAFAVIAVVHNPAVGGVLLFVAGFFLLAGLPVVLDWSELHAGPERGAGRPAFLLLAGNLGGVILALTVQAVIGNPYLARRPRGGLAGLALATRLPAPGAGAGQGAGRPRAPAPHRTRGPHATDVTDPMAELDRQLKPYRDQFPSFAQLPADGLAGPR